MNPGISSKAFIVKDSSVLIIRREKNDPHKGDLWEIPGGRLESGESPFDGLKREVKEEVNLEIKIIAPLNIHHFTREDGQVITMIVFLCKPLSTDIKLSSEHTEFEWIPLKEAKEKLLNFFFPDIDNYLKMAKLDS